MTKKGKDFQAYVMATLRKMRKNYPEWPLRGRIKMTIEICYGDKRKRDIKNSDKLLVDAMQKNLFIDDCQIDDIRMVRKYGDIKKIKVYAEEIGGVDETKN